MIGGPNFIIISLLFLLTWESRAQRVELSLVSSFTGSKYRLEYNKTWPRHSLSFGLQYLINSRIHDLDSDEFFKKRFFAMNATQHWGASVTYDYEVLRIREMTPIFFSYDFQLVRANLLGDTYIPTILVDNNQFYQYVDLIHSVTIALENNFCIGFKIPITSKLLLSQKIGSGIVSFHGISSTIRQKIRQPFDVCFFLFIGISYHFK